ncbi:MAG TPA: hypothetical protein VIN08_27335 [Ohtaekwangia sp.]|uniref:ankyrin repeat domain-containing protein n=1 Tax=Ohtaekwangia sp. TaxID=2066019 RepID=UPI002F9380D1
MNFSDFKFDGNWDYKINLPAFAGFQERKGAYTSVSSDQPNKGILTIEFEDDLTDNPDPYPEQLNTLKYIFENQESIVTAIVKRTLEELPGIIINYDLQKEEQFQELTAEKVKTLIGFNTITIKIVSKDNYSYCDVTGGCTWDEDHGLDILFHKDRVVSFSDINGGSYWDAVKDNGTYNEVKDGHKTIDPPRKYQAHPKYNKLKPSHKSANETYEYNLISHRFNEQFMKGVESGEIDINGKWESQDNTFLEAACWFNNNEIVEFLLSKKANIRYAMHKCVVYNSNFKALELLLQNGADVNYPYGNGNTVLFELVNALERFYPRNDAVISEDSQKKIEVLKEQITRLVSRGANPYIKNLYGHNCFDVMRNSFDLNRKAVNEFLEQCWNHRRKFSG